MSRPSPGRPPRRGAPFTAWRHTGGAGMFRYRLRLPARRPQCPPKPWRPRPRRPTPSRSTAPTTSSSTSATRSRRAHYYRAAFGFELRRLPRTRDRRPRPGQLPAAAGQGPLRPHLADRPRGRRSPSTSHCTATACATSRFWVDDAREAFAKAVERGATLGAGADGAAGRRTARSSSPAIAHLRRHDPLAGRAPELPRALPAGLRADDVAVPAGSRSGSSTSTTASATSSSAR